MTNFEKFTQSPEALATILSAAWHKADYEDGDYDPMFLNWLKQEVED